MGWGREIRDTIAQLKARRVQLEADRERAREEGTQEAGQEERLLREELQDISQRINDLRATLE